MSPSATEGSIICHRRSATSSGAPSFALSASDGHVHTPVALVAATRSSGLRSPSASCAPPSSRPAHSTPQFFDLARQGNTAAITAPLAAGLPANLTNDKGDTLLMLAAYALPSPPHPTTR